MMNSWKRSAKWPGSISHSRAGAVPIPGTQYVTSGATRSSPSAASHSAQRRPSSATAPAIHSGVEASAQMPILRKLSRKAPLGVTATTKALRPI